MTVEILTPEALLFKGEVTGVTVPGAKAPFQLFFYLSHRHTHQSITNPPLSLPLILPALPLLLLL